MKWINVNDQVPGPGAPQWDGTPSPHSDPVVAWFNDEGQEGWREAVYWPEYGNGPHWETADEGWGVYGVTHWMVIEKPGEEE